MIKQMRQTVFDDSNMTLFQSAINDMFSQFTQIPFINGVLLEGRALATGQANTLNHKLGQQATGYFITLNSANSVVWNDTISGDTSIVLRCSANTTVSVWVF